MNKKSPSTTISRFAEFASACRYGDIPERVREKVRLQIITSLTAAKFSYWHPAAYRIYAAEKKYSPRSGGSTVVALGESLWPEGAAVVNSAYSMSLDFDDYFLMGHSGHSAVFTPLAFLESSGGSMGDLVAATAVCNELMGRLSLSCFFGPLNGQMWSYIHNLGAAAAVGRVSGFDRTRMSNALSLALYQPNFCLAPGFWDEGSKLLTASIPLRAGIMAARCAAEGLHGPENIIEGPMGFLKFFSFSPVPEFMEGLGSSWLSDTLSYKRYPGTSYIAAPVEASLAAIKALGMKSVTDIDEIESVVVDTTFLSYNLEKLSRSLDPGSLNPITINFSVRYSIAYALLQGDLLPEHFKESRLRKFGDSIIKLAAKIRVRHDWGMTSRTLMTFPQVLRIIRRMESRQRKRIVEHLAELSGGRKSGFLDVITGLARFLARPSGRSMLRYLFAGKKDVSLSDVDLERYPMLQSARVRLSLRDGRSATGDVPIPAGGAGIALPERAAWVRERFRLAFRKDPASVLAMMADPKTPVRRFIREVMK